MFNLNLIVMNKNVLLLVCLAVGLFSSFFYHIIRGIVYPELSDYKQDILHELEYTDTLDTEWCIELVDSKGNVKLHSHDSDVIYYVHISQVSTVINLENK